MGKKKSKIQVKPLSQERVMKAFSKLPKSLREQVKPHMKGTKRHGSEMAARELTRKGKQDIALTKADRRLCAKLYAEGVTYREGEVMMGLKPANGNDFYRQVNNICSEDKKFAYEIKTKCKANGRIVPKTARGIHAPKKAAKAKPAPVAAPAAQSAQPVNA